MGTIHYSQADLAEAIRQTGLKRGDNVFVHANLGLFGYMADCPRSDDYCKRFKEALLTQIGEEGTLIVPTFSYSFCWGKDFDAATTDGVCGIFSEYIRKDAHAFRSDDPNFSVAAIGRLAGYFTENATRHSFGRHSFFDRFLRKEGIFCNFNYGAKSTFIHYVERRLTVPYRYDKAFSGNIKINGNWESRTFYHFVYDLENPSHNFDSRKFQKLVSAQGLSKRIVLGRGKIDVLTAGTIFTVIRNEIKKDPAFLIKGNDTGPNA